MCRPVRWTESRGRCPPRFLSAVRTRRRRRSKRESLAILLLVPFLAEDVLAAVLDALALVRLGLAPAADFGGKLANGLLVDPADLDRGLVRRLHLEPFGNVELHVVAVAELQLELLALCVRAVADTGDLEDLGEALRDALDQVRHERSLHAPMAASRLAVVGRSDRNRSVLELVRHELRQAHRKGALRPLHVEHAFADVRR